MTDEMNNIFDKLFDSSISRIALGVFLMIWIYSQIIIPIKELTVQTTSINVQLLDSKKFEAETLLRDIGQDRRLDSLERK